MQSTQSISEQVTGLLALVNPNVWVLMAAFWGGLIGFFSKVSSGSIERFTLSKFTIEVASSLFNGVLVFFLCLSVDMNSLLILAMVSIAGHMGTNLPTEIERYLTRMIESKFR